MAEKDNAGKLCSVRVRAEMDNERIARFARARAVGWNPGGLLLRV
jgi:hypothetical protein